MGQDKKDEAYSLSYHRLVFDELAELDSFWQERILLAIETKLLTQPNIFGKPLRQSLKGCRSLRVGDYRIVFQIEQKIVRILAVIHRSSNYKGLEKRV